MKKLLIILFLSVSGLIYSQYAQMFNDTSFSQGSTYWAATLGCEIVGGEVVFGAGVYSRLTQTNANMVSQIETSTLYTIEFTIVTSGNVSFTIFNSDQTIVYAATRSWENGYNKMEFVTPSNIGVGGFRILTAEATAAFTLDNISLTKNSTIGSSPYYVASDGDDRNSGSIDSPWETWGKAARNAVAGDTVWFRGGLYNIDKQIYLTGNPTYYYEDTIASGTYGNYIKFFGYRPDIDNGDSVIFDFAGIPVTEPDYDYVDSLYNNHGESGGFEYNTGFKIDYADYFHIRDMSFRNVLQRYRYVNVQGVVITWSENFILENLEVYNMGGHGVFTSNGSGVDTTYILNCDFYNCVDSFATNTFYYNLGQAASYGVGLFTVQSYSNQYMIIRGCRSWLNADDGFNTNPYGTIWMDSCWSFGNGVYLAYLDYTSPGNAYKLNNVLDTARYPDDPDHLQHYNTRMIAAFNEGVAFKENHPSGGATIRRRLVNSLAYSNWIGYAAGYEAFEGWVHRENEVINTIGYDNPSGHLIATQGAIVSVNEYNSWNAAMGITVTTDDFVAVPTDRADAISILSAPRTSNGSLPDIGDYFKLSPNSDLVNVGTDVGLNYSGAAPDLGPFEYNAVSNPDTTPRRIGRTSNGFVRYGTKIMRKR